MITVWTIIAAPNSWRTQCPSSLSQSRGLGSFGEVVLDSSEDASTRGFPPPSFNGIGFINLVGGYANYSAYATRNNVNDGSLPDHYFPRQTYSLKNGSAW